MRWPNAEVEMNAALVEELIRQQHPDLLIGSLRQMPPGFDNTIWRLGDDLVVRLPRREVGVHLIESEQRWLPELAARLPLQIPAPLRVGVPSDLFPWPWTIARWIDGTPGNLVDPAMLPRLARPLGGFFRALHRDAPEDAPTNPFRDVPLRTHDDNVHHRLEEAAEAVDRGELLRVWEASLQTAPWASAPQWIHGDPHPANLIVRDDALVGVIDFGDLCGGDPATDLAGGLLALPYQSLDEFFRAYGELDDATIRRTLGWAVHFGLMFVLLGESDEPTYGEVGRRALANALAYSRR
ncbi:MAG TPA: aminoglycoside phosphotransferase family protein [Acidimicrobiales bacterium]